MIIYHRRAVVSAEGGKYNNNRQAGLAKNRKPPQRAYTRPKTAFKIHEIIQSSTPRRRSMMFLKKPALLHMDEVYLRTLGRADYNALIKLNLQLIDQLKGALEREEQSPRNSSRPSGSQAPWDKPEDGAEEDDHDPFKANTQINPLPRNDSDALDANHRTQTPDAPAPKTAGKQPGAPGFGRTQKLPITDRVDHQLEQCQGCGANLPDKQVATTGFYSVDAVLGSTEHPGLTMSNTLHRYYKTDCLHCGLPNQCLPHRAAPDQQNWSDVGLTQWRLVGPSLAALIVYLSMDMRLTRRQNKRFFVDLFGLELSVGTLQNCMMEAARALAPVEEQLVDELLASDLIYVDETSHPEAGNLLWLWVFACHHTCVFQIGRRTSEIFVNMMASGRNPFIGWVMSDGYGVYRHWKKRLRCWGHVYRKGVGLCDSYTLASRDYGEQFVNLLDVLMQGVYQAREGPNHGTLSIKKDYQATLDDLKSLCQKMRDSKHKKTAALGIEMLKDWDVFMNVLDYPCWPLTNNEAERALRHWVILRRISYGTRSEQGSRALALFASIIGTCRLRRFSPLEFIRDVVSARRSGHDVPLMPKGTPVLDGLI